MTTKFDVGDAVLIKGIVETIYVETTDNNPIYHIRIKGAGTYEACGIRVKEDVIYCREVKNSEVKTSGAEMDEDAKQASIPCTYNAPQHDWKCGYPDIIRTCDNCKNISGLPSHNGTGGYSGKCDGCYDRCNWESKE